MVSVAACATPYTPIPYDREIAGLDHVSVMDSKLPEKATTQKLATNGQNMASAMAASAGLAGVLVGAVAAGIEAGIEAGQRDRMLAVLDSVDFDGQAIFDAALNESLAEGGYEIDSVHFDRKSTAVLIETPVADETKAGYGFLDVAGAGYGYQLVGGNTEWRPFVSVSVRMTDRVNPGNVLLENKVVYNPVATPDVIVNIAPDGEYSFAKIEDMESDPERTAKGLEVALVETARAIAQLAQ
ncbi:MAG: hypothetical protein VR75_00080 [Hyphomonadaceae bacterium BRH_c29]|nr:MAG: hypothetical protein VR75_00080 [Hyphomonadaceae bacterium BRH_c29]